MNQGKQPQTIEPVIAPPAGLCASLPLVEELDPSLTPWDACQRLAHLPRLLFLDSASNEPAALSRYSYVTADPFVWIWSRGGRYWLTLVNHRGAVVPSSESLGDPFGALARWLNLFEAVPVA